MIQRKLIKRVLAPVGLSLALLSVAGCRKAANKPAPETGNINIGVVADLSGPTSPVGQATKNAIELARDEINQAGGINGRKLEVVVADDKGSADQAVSAVNSLTTQQKFHALIGESSAAASLAAAANAQAAQLPTINLAAGDAKGTQQGDYIFNVASLDASQGKQMGDYAATNLKAKTAAILFEDGSDYGAGLAQSFADEFTKLGGQVSSRQPYSATGNNFNQQLTSISAASPDVLYIPGRSPAVAMIAKEAKQLNLKAVLLGTDGWNDPDVLSIGGSAFDGAYITSHYSANDPSPEARAFTSAYSKRFGKAPDQTAALAYDAIKIIVDALRRSGSSEKSKLRDALAQTSKFAGLTGSITIAADRNAAKPAIIFKLQDRKIYPVFKEES
jgi:branched-chain amino acid transport system substrate-binding protein